MDKQEWIQKYLEDILADAWRKGGHKQGIDVTEEANKARFHLTKWGVVIKVTNKTQLNGGVVATDNFVITDGKRDLVAVEPLIKELRF